MKLWEVHNLQLGGAIATTPEGGAEIGGLAFSEKAYILAVRDFRPKHLVSLVRQHGAVAAADILVEHTNAAEALQVTGGRGLVTSRGPSGGPTMYRSDEIEAATREPARLRL